MIFFFLCLFSCSVFSEQRIALVIGNADYKTAPLKNPANDANDIANTLARAGFDVELVINESVTEIRKASAKFASNLENSKGMGFFYYAGHGVQLNGENYLVAVDSNFDSASSLKQSSFSLSELMEMLKQANNGMNVVVLDACRDNPFQSKEKLSRGFGRVNANSSLIGLAKVEPPKGTLVSYATSPGDVAFDGSGKNGLYTKHLLNELNSTGSRIETVFQNTIRAVYEDSEGSQIPWLNSSFYENFYFFNSQPSNQFAHEGDGEFTVFRSNVYEDNVFINGKPYGPTPLKINLQEGLYDVVIKKNGFKPWSSKINVKASSENIHWGLLKKELKLIRYKNGDRFVGSVVNNKREGKGIYIYSKSNKIAKMYIGDYKNNKREGFGSYYQQNGDKYVGDYLNNKRHGVGTITYNDGSVFYGAFYEGKKHGKGTLLKSNGIKYIGSYIAGSKEGDFSLIQPNGKAHMVEFNNNEYVN